MNKISETYRQQVHAELQNILQYWTTKAPDYAFGGFHGKIANDNTIDHHAAKGSVLNSRILWTFSAAYNHKPYSQTLAIAERAFSYIANYFIDKKNGGVYWSVDYKGNALDTKKQVYAIAFAVYAISEYAIATEGSRELSIAIDLYKSIVQHSYDGQKGGYIEALTADWKEATDLRLSAKDWNEKKSMNTHLHVVEAFANLYRIWPNDTLKLQIEELLNIFLDHIIDKQTNHLILFFDEDWNAKRGIVSYGHDIEAAWLLLEAAEIIGNKALITKFKQVSVNIAEAATRGLDADGGLWYESEHGTLIKEKHWWPQAEAMVGFYNAYQITGEQRFLELSYNSWEFTKQHLLDKQNGEWFWGVDAAYAVMDQDKAGLWKCPYHNGRACIELLKRLPETDMNR